MPLKMANLSKTAIVKGVLNIMYTVYVQPHAKYKALKTCAIINK